MQGDGEDEKVKQLSLGTEEVKLKVIERPPAAAIKDSLSQRCR